MCQQRTLSILFYSLPSASLLVLSLAPGLANESSYSSSYQFDSPAVSSLLDLDLDSFSAATEAPGVTQVDD